jgi:hypothetical protein
MSFLEKITGNGKKEFSARSQRTLREEQKLRAQLARCESEIARHEREIHKLEESKQRQLKASVEGGYAQWLGRTLEELEDRKRQVAAFREQQTLLRSEIARLAPTPASAIERAERQNRLLQLAEERLKKDELADGALRALRHLLEERAQLTAKMLKAAEAADLTIGEDRLDSVRCEQLLAYLPEELLPGSERWHAWFIGKQEDAKPYVVVVDELVLPESLAHAGFYHFGDKLELADSEASELLSGICPLGKARHDLSWSYEPRRIMPLKEFEALVQEASDQGEAVQTLHSRRNKQREAELREQYVMEYQQVVRKHHQAMRAEGRLVGADPAED